MITKTETTQDGAGKEIAVQKYNHLAPAEMMNEDNYNQIDGVLSNASKPTFEERMKNAKSKAYEHNARKSDRHKKARHNSQSERHKKERR